MWLIKVKGQTEVRNTLRRLTHSFLNPELIKLTFFKCRTYFVYTISSRHLIIGIFISFKTLSYLLGSSIIHVIWSVSSRWWRTKVNILYKFYLRVFVFNSTTNSTRPPFLSTTSYPHRNNVKTSYFFKISRYTCYSVYINCDDTTYQSPILSFKI